MKSLRKFVPAVALAGAMLAAALPGGSAKAQTVPFSSGFQVQNLASVGATISMAFYPEDSTSASDTVGATIPANGQVTYATLPSAVDAGFKGSAVISSDQRIAAIVNLISPNLNNLSLGSSYVGVTGGSQSVSLPLLFKNSFDFNTFFSVQNVGQAATQVTVTYSGGGLNSPVTEQATIQPGAAHRFDQQSNPNLPNGFNGSAVVTSTASDIAAVVTQWSSTTSLTYNGFAAGTTDPFFPLVNANNAGFITGISLQNIGTASTNVTVTYTPSSAGQTCTETKTIPAKGTAFFALNSFSTTPESGVTENCANGATFVGSARVTTNSANQPLVGIVNQLNQGTRKGGSYSSFDASAGTNTVVFPLIQDRYFGYFTGISIVNTGSVPTTIECTFSGSSQKQTSGTIQPGGSYTVIQNNVIAADYNGSGRCVANASGAQIVGIANQLGGGNVDTFFVYEGTNN